MTVVQNDVLRMTAEMSVGSFDIQNIFHYQYTSVASVTDAQALLDAAVILEALYDIILEDLSITMTFDQVRVQNITQDVLLGTTGWPVLTAGEEASGALPLTNAALLTFTTAVPRTRGGTYYGGMTEIQNTTAGTILAATVTRLVALALEQLTEQNLSGRLYSYILVNREFGTVIPFTAAIVHTVFRTQRRRRPGVGS